jgi:hypothetical protein
MVGLELKSVLNFKCSQIRRGAARSVLAVKHPRFLLSKAEKEE